MKILLIDNLTLNSEYIKNLLKDHAVEVQIYNQINKASVSNCDLIILSGTKHDYMGTVLSEWDNLQAEREVILNSSKPIIGICYGCELIAAVYDSKLDFYEVKVTGDYELTLHKDIGFDLSKKIHCLWESFALHL